MQKNDGIFIDTYVDSSDSEDKKQITRIKCELVEKGNGHDDKFPGTKHNLKKWSSRTVSAKSSEEIKGFVVDAENRYHCLDCGKKFARKHSYMQHSRL